MEKMLDQNNTKKNIVERALSLYPYFQAASRNKYPDWFSALNLISILPILLCPLVFYGSIFLFDNPQNTGATFLKFLLVNSYSVIMLMISAVSFKLFNRARVLAVIIPGLLILTWMLLFYLIFTSGA